MTATGMLTRGPATMIAASATGRSGIILHESQRH
jgi:hypothetical protein